MKELSIPLAEPTKAESKGARGIAALAMVMLHLFCNYNPPCEILVYAGKYPLIYYFGLLGSLCVPAYCFLIGYAQFLIYEKNPKAFYKSSFKRVVNLYINYAVVVVVFAIVGLIVRNETIPGSITTFLGNVFIVGMSYNGAWWFLPVYIILVFMSPLFVKIVNKVNPILIFLVSGFLYFVTYAIFVGLSFDIEIQNPVLSWLWKNLIHILKHQFALLLGMMFYKYKIISRIKYAMSKKKWLIPAFYVGMIIVILICSIEESAILDPFRAVSALVCFYTLPHPKFVKKFFGFLGEHSTNIWFVHMFYYIVLFKGLVFKAKYSLLVLIFMLALCIATSYVIKFIISLINKALPKKSEA